MLFEGRRCHSVVVRIKCTFPDWLGIHQIDLEWIVRVKNVDCGAEHVEISPDSATCLLSEKSFILSGFSFTNKMRIIIVPTTRVVVRGIKLIKISEGLRVVLGT